MDTTVRHPCDAFEFNDLVRELEIRVKAGLVRVARPQDGRSELELYKYTPRAGYRVPWDPITVLARGLVLDRARGKVTARTFPKFFNFGEWQGPLPGGRLRGFEKLDGSMIAVWHDGERWRATTNGAFASPQVRWTEARFASMPMGRLTPGDTWLFEAIYEDNLIVVRYPYEGLVAIGGYAADGREFSWREVETMAAGLGVCAAPTYEDVDLDALLARLPAMGLESEGFVVRYDQGGFRLKLKGHGYLELSRLLSRVAPTELCVVMMRGGSELEEMRLHIPEEFRGDFDQIVRLLEAEFDRFARRVEQEKERLAGLDDRSLAASPDLDEELRAFVFKCRKIGDSWRSDPMVRKGILRKIRPVNNVLEGYEPSHSLRRAIVTG